MASRSSSTALPPIRRKQRRDPGRALARVLCVLFALVGLVPLMLAAVVKTPWARAIATRETQKIVRTLGIDASYELSLELWPLAVTLENIRVEASDGGTPFLTARRASARPKIFALLAGKLAIEQIELDRPEARVVLKGGELANLKLELPKSDKSEPMRRLPFSVVSTSEAFIDLTIDDNRVVAREVDVDVTSDEAFEDGIAVEVAIRALEAHSTMVRDVAATADKPARRAVDEDVLCNLDGRARIEPKRILVRRLSAFGAADLDDGSGTGLGCDATSKDKGFVEIVLGHLAVDLPKAAGELPNVDGHAKVRLPIGALNRIPGTPYMDGWVSLDAAIRYAPDTPIPDMDGHFEAEGIQIDHFRFARSIRTDLTVQKGVVTTALLRLEIAEGVAELKNVEVKPLAKGIPLRADLDAHDVSFVALMQDLGIAKRPHVTWDLRDVHAENLHGTLDPLRLDGDLVAHTTNFAVYDKAVDDPARTRAIGLAEGNIRTKVVVRADALEFHQTGVRTPRGTISNALVSIGFHEVIRVEVPDADVDLADISPIGNVAMGGRINAKNASVIGPFSDPKIKGDVSIQNYTLGDPPNEISFGNITQGQILVEHLDSQSVSLIDVHAQKGKSNYELSTGRLDFGGAASMQLDGQVTSKNLDLRDFFSVFKMDEDPRFLELGGTVETSARIHFALGGPEDKCKGGYLDVSASTSLRDMNLLGERFDAGHADFDFRWQDRLAGLDGAEIDVRSVSLAKVKKEGRPASGTVLGSVFIRPGGDLRGSLVMQGFPLARANLLGSAARNVEGSASGVVRLSGTVSAFAVDADIDVTPVRIFGVPFGSSDVHFGMTQDPKPAKVVGRTPCGGAIGAPFDKEAYLNDASVQGAYTLDGALFGGQVRLDKVVVTRQKNPVAKGRIELAKLDLAPIGRILASRSDPDEPVDPDAPKLGGQITGEFVLDEVSTADLSHAKGRFAPKSIVVTRGEQKLEWKPQPVVAVLEHDDLLLPHSVFEISAGNGLKGTFSVDGSVDKLTRGGELSLVATLAPIDLGILVGAVPRLTRAMGTLSGSVRLAGKASSPEFDGELKVRGGEFGIKGLPSGITDVNVDVLVDENEARVTRGTGKFLGGDVALAARVPIKGGQLGVAEATLTGRQLYLSPIEGVKATIDADLAITMNPQAASTQGRLPFVGGDVTITSFEATKPFTLNLTNLRGGSKRTVVESYDPTQDAVTLGFDVHARAPLRIRNNLVEAQLAIDPRGIHVSGTNQRIGLRGELTTLPGGRFRVFANDFDIQKATISFDDPTRIVPHVDVVAVTEYRRYSNTLSSTSGAVAGSVGGIASGGRGGNLWRITLHAYGDLEELNIDMTSDPALSREDIFFLLTIGLTRAEVDQVRAGSVYASAAFEAIGTVSGVDRAVKQAIPVIDDFRPGTAYSPRTGRVEPNITVGRRLGENVRARLTSGLAEDPQLRSTIEWRLNRAFTVEPSYDRINSVSSSNVGNFGVDFRWRLEFD